MFPYISFRTQRNAILKLSVRNGKASVSVTAFEAP